MSEAVRREQITAEGGRFILPVILTPGEDGYLVASCPIIPGCISQGRIPEEALANIAEAAQLALACRNDEGWDLPVEYVLEQIEVGGSCRRFRSAQAPRSPRRSNGSAIQ